MLYIGYLIILDGKIIKKNWFWKFPFLSCRGWKIAGCALAPLGSPPQHPNRVKNTQGGAKTCFT